MSSTSSKVATVAMVLSSAFLSGCGKGIDSGNGNQIGTIVKMGVHGAICPTIEGEMALQNIRGAGGSSTLHFNVQDPEIQKKLQKAMEDRTTVEVTYSKRSFYGRCTMEDDMILTSVKEFNESGAHTNPRLSVAQGNNPAANQNLQSGDAVALSCVAGAKGTLSCEVK